MFIIRCFVFTGLLILPLNALAQSPKPAPSPTPAQTETKPTKKPRSEAQKKNDARMRACGQEWREAKRNRATEGKTWRQFSLECRRKKKASG